MTLRNIYIVAFFVIRFWNLNVIIEQLSIFHPSHSLFHFVRTQIIHRDLAARNILITDDHTCKVADFGFARDVITSKIYERKSEGKLPIRYEYCISFSGPGKLGQAARIVTVVVVDVRRKRPDVRELYCGCGGGDGGCADADDDEDDGGANVIRSIDPARRCASCMSMARFEIYEKRTHTCAMCSQRHSSVYIAHNLFSP